MFQEEIDTWLSRTEAKRAINQCFDLPVVLATDIGLVRRENQDRVAALRIGSHAHKGCALIAIAVADGMGGMRDGGRCANLALSSFFQALVTLGPDNIERRASAALNYANNAVFRFANGKGGTTLSAVLMDNDLRPIIAQLGDSRVYSFSNDGKVERLTVDDSLADAFGGQGRELLQFVGMGPGMQPHVLPIETSIRSLAITTDGLHFVEPITFASVLSHSADLKSASERLAALARWCGGHDNASSALVDLQLLQQEFRKPYKGVRVWDPFGALTALWIEGKPNTDVRDAQAIPAVSHSEPESRRTQLPAAPTARPKAKPTSKKAKTSKGKKRSKEDIQLEIQIERDMGPKEPNDNSQ